MSASFGDRQLLRSDMALLGLFSLALFAISLVGGRVLTMHESRLPQASREMYTSGEWLIPTCGGRPWLERPPLPHWITIGVASLFGRCDQVWIVRIPPALAGVFCVVVLASLAAGWFGRGIGILSGLILATTFEFTRYAWLAEEDIFLAAIVLLAIALFVRLEFFRAPRPAIERNRLFGLRPWLVLAFFVVLGLTNLVKGLLFGMAMVLIPVAGFLVWNADLKRVSRYLWIWGWIVCAAAASAWIVAASQRHPDLLALWMRDVANRTDNVSRVAPVWYYGLNLLWEILPWTGPALFGMWLTREKALGRRYSAERFLWCWALLPLLVFSIPAHKHHHYLVPCLAPWAVLGALGSVRIWEQAARLPHWVRTPVWPALGVGVPCGIALVVCSKSIPGPGWVVLLLMLAVPAGVFGIAWAIDQRNPRVAAGTLFGILGSAYLTGHLYSGLYVDSYRDDSRFLNEIRQMVDARRTIYVNSESANLNMFRHLFYLGDNARLLHNLTFLRDDRIQEREVYVLARFQDRAQLDQLGSSQSLLESVPPRKGPPEMRWTLFRLQFAENLVRYSTRDVRFTASQVMEREPGPYLGQRL